MTTQSTIDRINDAIIALGRQKDRLLRGNARRPDSEDALFAEICVRIVASAGDAIGFEYDAADASLVRAVDDMGWPQASINADDRLEQVRR